MSKIKISLLSGLIGGTLGASIGAVAYRSSAKKLEKEKKQTEKLVEFYKILIQWLSLKQEKKSLVEYFKKNNYKVIAIYGMKELGERLLEELKGTEIAVKYAIDKQAEYLLSNIDIVVPNPNLEEVDVIIVTAIHYYDEIEREMSEYVDCPIVSLEDVIYDLV
ncbi:MAG: hypothetical protein PUI46_02400 [Lachnospiraceae bacterium]|nr:hypothetical protein [Lachnospiraceae bacterium]